MVAVPLYKRQKGHEKIDPICKEARPMKSPFLEYTDRDVQEFGTDVALAAMALGLPDAYHLYDAIERGDTQDIVYYCGVIMFTHAAYSTIWQQIKMYDILVHGGKNIRGLSFHKVMQGKGTLVFQGVKAASRAVAPVAIPVAISVGGAIGYEKYVNEPLREAHDGGQTQSWLGDFMQGTWFGPYASGFGSAV